MERVYLDYAATMPLRPAALNAMLPYLHRPTSNPASSYASARQSKKALEKARDTIAQILGARSFEIFFTSGGTESDNWALRSVIQPQKPQIITSQAEHHAILDTCEALRKDGFEVVMAQTDSFAAPRLDHVAQAVSDATALISVMYANNETGTITDIGSISQVAREKGVPLHTDAVAACGHIPMDVNSPRVDLMSISAHKFGGPVGVGVLYIREGTGVSKYMHGGSQERNLRAGTQNVAGAVGMAAALDVATSGMREESARLAKLRDDLRKDLTRMVPDIRFTSPSGDRCLPGHVHFILPGVLSEAALVYLDRIGFECSAGSACTVGAAGPSHVLLASGICEEDARCAIRVSIGDRTCAEDLHAFAKAVKELSDRKTKTHSHL